MSKRKITGSIMATIGYLLSPLSWWNDLFINIPLAYGFGLLGGLLNKNLFLPSMLFAYWLSNIVGFILLHQGAKKIISNTEKKYSKKDLGKDMTISMLYTLLVIALIKIGWLKFPWQ